MTYIAGKDTIGTPGDNASVEDFSDIVLAEG